MVQSRVSSSLVYHSLVQTDSDQKQISFVATQMSAYDPKGDMLVALHPEGSLTPIDFSL
jgi:hypothetical protein